MTIKLLILKSGENIVSDVKELVIPNTEKVYGYLLNKPQKISYDNNLFLVETKESENPSVKVSLTPWIILTNEEDVLITTDWVVTMVTPIDTLEKMYADQINGSTN